MIYSRLQKVIEKLKQEKADALLVWNLEKGGQPATHWLSGFTGSSSVLLISSKARVLVTDSRYIAQAKREAKGFKVIILTQHEPTTKILKRLVTEHRLQKVLVDGTVTPFSAVEDIRKEMSRLVLYSKKRVLQELRTVKDKDEITLLKKAAGIGCHAFTRLLPKIRTGISEKELAFKLELLAREEGADEMAFPTIVAAGAHAADPHACAGDKKLVKGELVLIDWGVRYKGYVSDMTRMVAVGKISPRLRDMYEAVRKAQELGCNKARAGIAGQALDAVCRNYLTKKGFGKYFTHSTGHGIGMEVHELPIVSQRGEKGKKGERGLPAGAVVTCEPGVYIPDVGGVRIEDTLILTKNGNINLTKGVTKKLIVI